MCIGCSFYNLKLFEQISNKIDSLVCEPKCLLLCCKVHPDVHFIGHNFNNKSECKVYERSHYILFWKSITSVKWYTYRSIPFDIKLIKWSHITIVTITFYNCPNNVVIEQCSLHINPVNITWTHTMWATKLYSFQQQYNTGLQNLYQYLGWLARDVWCERSLLYQYSGCQKVLVEKDMIKKCTIEPWVFLCLFWSCTARKWLSETKI
jgi:hypothetical protein